MRKEAFGFGLVLAICVIIVVLISGVSSFLAFTADHSVNTLSVVPAVSDYSEGWITSSGFATKLNSFSVNEKELSADKPLIFTKTVKTPGEDRVIMLHTLNLVTNIYIENEPIHITAESGRIKKADGFENYIIAQIPDSAVGKNIRLEFYKTNYSFSARINRMLIGPGSAIMKSLIIEGIFPLIVGELTVVIGIGFIILGLFVRKKLDSYLSSIFFGVFVIFMSASIIFHTAWAHLVINSPVYIETTLQICQVACIPAFLAYIDSTFDTEHYYPLKIWTIIVSALIVAVFVLDRFDIVSFVSVGLCIHIVMLLSGIIASVEMILFVKRTRGAGADSNKLGYVSVFFLVICGSVDFIIYYTQPIGGNGMFFSCFGLLFITAVALRTRFVEIMKMIKLGIQAGRIGKIAFTDANTGIGNAAAFKAKFDELEAGRHGYKYIGIIQFDVNNLKVINDSKGHEAGDLLIKTAANIINNSFGIAGTCYRTGGDEFVALLVNDHAPITCEEAIYKFNKLIDKFNADPEKPFELRIAHGVAYYQNDSNGEISLKEVHKMADERMYSNKKMLKAKYAHTAEEAEVR